MFGKTYNTVFFRVEHHIPYELLCFSFRVSTCSKFSRNHWLGKKVLIEWIQKRIRCFWIFSITLSRLKYLDWWVISHQLLLFLIAFVFSVFIKYEWQAKLPIWWLSWVSIKLKIWKSLAPPDARQGTWISMTFFLEFQRKVLKTETFNISEEEGKVLTPAIEMVSWIRRLKRYYL